MNIGVAKTIGITVINVTAILVIGELFGGVVSKPIAMMQLNKIKGCDPKAVAVMFDVMNQRICDLEEKVGTEA